MSSRSGLEPVTSPTSRKVTALRRLVRRSWRDKERRFLVEGPQAVREAAAARLPDGAPALLELLATERAAQRHPEILAAAREAGVAVREATEEVLAAVGQTVTPQGLLGVARFVDLPLAAVLDTRPRLVAVLAEVRDPGNAGTVVRTADAVGADAVILTDASVDPYHPKAVRASAGSLFHLPVVTGVPVGEAVDGLRGAGLRVLAADGAAPADLETAAAAGRLAGPVGWLFGNEARGLPEEVAALADEVLRVPIHGRAESLNLATAAAVCLYSTSREQRAHGG